MRSLLQLLPLISLQKNEKRKTIRTLAKTCNVGVQSLCHGVFTIFQCHNASSYDSEQKALIISLLTSCNLVKTPQTLTVNDEVASWWKGNAKNDFSSLRFWMCY
jgi:hypothetical protein